MGECKSSGNKQICKSLHELLTECFTSENASVPTRDRFAVPLTFEQFFSAVLLGIFPIQNLEPSAVLSLCDVRCRFLLGNNALQVQFADSLKQSHPAAIDVLGIFQRSAGPCQQPPKFLFAVQQSLCTPVLAFTDQQVTSLAISPLCWLAPAIVVRSRPSPGATASAMLPQGCQWPQCR